jgi:Fe-S-cluster containining protein
MTAGTCCTHGKGRNKNILVQKYEEQRQLWTSNVDKLGKGGGVGFDDVDWIQLAQDKVQCRIYKFRWNL